MSISLSARARLAEPKRSSTPPALFQGRRWLLQTKQQPSIAYQINMSGKFYDIVDMFLFFYTPHLTLWVCSMTPPKLPGRLEIVYTCIYTYIL